MNEKLCIKAIRICIGTLVILSVAVGLIAFWHPARVLALFLSGRTVQCTFSESLRSADQTARQVAKTKHFRDTSRPVKANTEQLQLWQTERGPFWVIAEDDMLSFHRELAEQETGIYAGKLHAVWPGDVVLDCGARYGGFSRSALKAGARLVVAIEPNPLSLECLRRNLSDEIRAGRVVLYPKGVWDKDDLLPLMIDPENSANDSVVKKHGDGGEILVPLTTIDKLVAELNLERVDFIKMDIEGAETRAVSGAAMTIEKFRPTMAICVYHQPEDAVQIPRLVRRIRPDYQYECACKDWVYRIEPEVAFFY
jgi:FkbM family methyltransferase